MGAELSVARRQTSAPIIGFAKTVFGVNLVSCVKLVFYVTGVLNKPRAPHRVATKDSGLQKIN